MTTMEEINALADKLNYDVRVHDVGKVAVYPSDLYYDVDLGELEYMEPSTILDLLNGIDRLESMVDDLTEPDLKMLMDVINIARESPRNYLENYLLVVDAGWFKMGMEDLQEVVKVVLEDLSLLDHLGYMLDERIMSL